ncbi:hypothetical protein [Halorubrum sp. DTA98]|uniref:hypothetical protein n=1 Tax=Halorubrum sp. DTA98 TaxID=3402163 RepID=UPI003AAB2CA8
MRPFTGGIPHCKRCGYEIEGNEERCPGCGFAPRQMGIRVSMAFLLVVVVSMTVVMLVPAFAAEITPVLVALAALSFALAVITFLVSLLATPYRLGSLFSRF